MEHGFHDNWGGALDELESKLSYMHAGDDRVAGNEHGWKRTSQRSPHKLIRLRKSDPPDITLNGVDQFGKPDLFFANMS